MTARDDFSALNKDAKGEEEIQLTAREFNLTYKLLSYPNKTFTRVQLMDEFWDADSNATPLSVMQNYSTMLQSTELDEKTRTEYAKAISSNCRKLTGLITNILKLNKLENQHIYPTVPPYDLGEQIRECVLGFEENWTAKNLNVEAEIADGIMVTVDAELLSLVWNNFITNAIKFTPEGGNIYVRLEQKDEDKICISVEDSGCGMDERTKEHVFEKFFQGGSSHAAQGNGLGLALASKVALICKGEIGVESEPNKGSRFYFNLDKKNSVL